MNTLPGIVLLSLALSCAATSARAQELPQALAENFFSPELVRMAQPALHLSQEQKATLQDALNRVEPYLTQSAQRLQQENRKLLEMVKAEKLDSDAVMAQAERVMRLELETKRASLALLLKLRETLTPEQQAKLREFKAKTAGFQARIRQAMDLAKQWKQQGRDTSGFEQARQQFEGLMGSGDFNAAEALLDTTLKHLKQPPSPPKQ